MSKKPAIIGLGIFVVLVIIALIIYLFTRPSKSTETEDLPTVKDAGVGLILNPGDKTDKVEEYSIFTTEYAIGETTAKNVDVILTWTNGPAFAAVESLIFVHKNKNGAKVRDNVTTDYNIQSNETNELIFDGEKLTNEDIIGTNTIDMYWNEVKESNKLTTISFKITQEHLDTTLNLDNAETIDIPVQLSSSSDSEGIVTSEYTKYTIPPFFMSAVYIRKSDTNDKGFHVIKDNVKQEIDGVDTFYIVKALGKDFISKDASGNDILRGDTKKFASKNDIFGDVGIMDSSAIEINKMGECLFVKPPAVGYESFILWYSQTKKAGFDARCADSCDSNDIYFKESDFDFTPKVCSGSWSKRINCSVSNNMKESQSKSAKEQVKDLKYKDVCKYN
jgi:hypothetical protein